MGIGWWVFIQTEGLRGGGECREYSRGRMGGMVKDYEVVVFGMPD